MEKHKDRIMYHKMAEESKHKDNMITLQKNVYVQCPTHHDFEITNICTAAGCLEPLCPECVKIHLTLHENSNTRPVIDTIFDMKGSCLDHIIEIKRTFLRSREILYSFSDKKKGEVLKSCKEKLFKAKEKIIELVNNYFATLEKEVNKSIEKHKITHPGEFNRINERINRVIMDLEKNEAKLSGPDYLKPMLKVLYEQDNNNNYEGLKQEIDFGLELFAHDLIDIQVDESQLFLQYQDLQKYVSLSTANISKITFSQLFIEREEVNKRTQPVASAPKLVSDRHKEKFQHFRKGLRPNNFRQNFTHYFPNSNPNTSPFKPEFIENNERSLIESISEPIEKEKSIQNISPDSYHYEYNKNIIKAEIHNKDYFNKDCIRKFLFYFEENTKSFFYLNLYELFNSSLQGSFIKKELHIPFRIPICHRAVITPNGEIFVCGGIEAESRKRVLKNMYMLDYENRMLVAVQSMGLILTNFNDRILIKCGGKLDPFLKNEPNFEIYDISLNEWVTVAYHGHKENIPIFNLFAASVQLNETDIAIFGGESIISEKDPTRNCSYILRMQIQPSFKATLYKFNDLPVPGTYTTPVIMENQTLFALENVQEGRGKVGKAITVLTSGESWKTF